MANYKGCEEAKHPKCECKCGGAFHGKAHSGKAWEEYLKEWEEHTRIQEVPEDIQKSLESLEAFKKALKSNFGQGG